VPYVVGNAIDGYCKKCRSDTNHTILEVEGHQVRAVRCLECSSEGPFRSPRARTKAGLREVAAKRKTRPPARRSRKKQDDPAEIYRQLLEGRDLSEAVPYKLKNPLDEGDLIDHPKFGIGIVVSVTEPTKASVAFEDRSRVMVCNWK
jgi:hypothetical protein